MPVNKDKTTPKDVFVLGIVYLGLLSLVLIILENDTITSAVVLATYALAGFIVVERIK